MPLLSRSPTSPGVTIALTVAPLMSIYAPLGLAPLAIALALVAARELRRPYPLPAPRLFWAAAGALALWGFATAAWSIQPEASLKQAAKLAGMVLLAWLALRPGWRLERLTPVALGFTLALLAAWVEHLARGAVLLHFREAYDDYLLNRGMCFLTVMLWPLLGLCWARLAPARRAFAAAALLAATAATVLSLDSLSAITGLLAGIAAASLAAWGGRSAMRFLAWAAPLACVALLAGLAQLKAEPAAEALSSLPQSALHRLYIWEFAATRAVERPVLGWGLGSPRHLPGAQTELWPDKVLMPLHPHNSLLQLWLELGLPGLAGFLLMLHASFSHLSHLPRLRRACGAGALSAYVVAGLTGFGIWQEWWLATGILAWAGMAMLMRERPAPAAHSHPDRHPRP